MSSSGVFPEPSPALEEEEDEENPPAAEDEDAAAPEDDEEEDGKVVPVAAAYARPASVSAGLGEYQPASAPSELDCAVAEERSE